MLSTLITAVLSTNDTELIGRVALYVIKIGGERALSLLHQLHTRLRHGSDWGAYIITRTVIVLHHNPAEHLMSQPIQNIKPISMVMRLAIMM